jgi:hypothetical protein
MKAARKHARAGLCGEPADFTSPLAFRPLARALPVLVPADRAERA